MIFRGKILGIGDTVEGGPVILIRPYTLEEGDGPIPITAEALMRRLQGGKKVRIIIEEEVN